MNFGKSLLHIWKRHNIAIAACAVLAIFYFSQSDPFAAGFYQQDEVGHYIQMITFWKDPLTLLTDMWARGGYKILYAIPGLAGWTGITLTNIFFAVGSGYLAYLLALKYGMRHAWMAVVFTGLQPLMVTLAFRCYPELPATFFIMLLLYTYENKKYIATALIASFLFSIRQELAIIAVILAVLFILKKQWLPVLCLLAAPLVLSILGYIKHGDPLYIVHMVVQGGLIDNYRRNGFFYLWVMLPDVTGILVFYLLVISGAAFFVYKSKKQVLAKYHLPLLISVLYFLMHCLFTSETLGFGRSGGATRFLLPLVPIVSLFALRGLNYLLSQAERRTRIIVAAVSLVPGLCLIGFQDYFKTLSYFGFNTLSYTGINAGLLILAFVAVLACITLPTAAKKISYAIPVLVVLYSIKCVTPIPLSSENELTSMAADWLYNANVPFDKLYTDHVMFNYYYGLKTESYEASSYDSLNFTSIRQSDIIVYDTHYASKSVRPQYFNKFRSRYQVIKEFIGDGNFKIFLLRGLAPH